MKLQMATAAFPVQSPVFRAAQPMVSSRADDDHSCGSRRIGVDPFTASCPEDRRKNGRAPQEL